jgi:hypothetical protein
LESVGGAAGEKQVPCGNGRKKSKSNNKCNSRFPAGMEERKARATASATAGSLREWKKEKQEQQQVQQQVPCGNGRKKSKSNSKCNSRFPAGMEDKKSNNVRQRMRR